MCLSQIDTFSKIVKSFSGHSKTFEAVLKWPLTETKHFNAHLNLFFNESAWKSDVWLLKWKYVWWYFSFFCQCYRTPVSADRFSRVPLYRHFYPKIDSNAHLNSVFPNIASSNRKIVNTVRFFTINFFFFFFFLILCIYDQNWLQKYVRK